MISIIIPVYNTPPDCMKRCIESIRKEKYDDIEIILVNDGSDDDACLEYLEGGNSADIRIYNQTNRGVSAARNLGIEKAKGEYIAFIDADDEIMGGFLHEASEIAVQYDLDIIFGSIQFIPDIAYSGIQGAEKFLLLKDQEINEVKKSILEKKTAIFPTAILGTPCARLYRASICKKIGFDENIRICEDQIFNLYALEESAAVGIYPAYWYKYYQNQFSAMHSMKSRWDLYPYFEGLERYSEKCDNKEISKWIDTKVIGYMSGILKRIVCSDCGLRMKWEKIKDVAAVPMFHQVVGRLKWYDGEISVWRRIELVVWKWIESFNKRGC